MDIGEKIRTIRKQKGIKQKDLAKQVGLTTNGLQKIEYGEVTPKATTVHKIASALNVSDIDLDDRLQEMLVEWNDKFLSTMDTLREDAKIFDQIIKRYGQETASTINDFLSLDPEGQEKVSEYIDFLMQKHRKE